MSAAARLARQRRLEPRGGGFTLIEILVVVAIIGVLAAILLPVFAQARAAARRASCASNIRQIGLAARLYANDNGRLPSPDSLAYPTPCGWPDVLFRYTRNAQIFSCPERKSVYNPACGQQKTMKYAGSYQMICARLHVTRTEPSKGIYIMDGNGAAAYPQMEDADGTVHADAEHIATGVGPPRHGEGYNVGFLDGHVKWLRPEDMGDTKMWGWQYKSTVLTPDPVP